MLDQRNDGKMTKHNGGKIIDMLNRRGAAVERGLWRVGIATPCGDRIIIESTISRRHVEAHAAAISFSMAISSAAIDRCRVLCGSGGSHVDGCIIGEMGLTLE